MAHKSRPRTARLTITILLSLGLIATAPPEGTQESTVPPAPTGCDIPHQQDHTDTPLEGSPELWKFRRLTQR
ncbi:hypothetical protein SAMN05444745_103233 [Arthrobacter sp. OV608]|nr:hypothetical protein SAMN05444745_103233 [Arthrobacter sp. OV608]